MDTPNITGPLASMISDAKFIPLSDSERTRLDSQFAAEDAAKLPPSMLGDDALPQSLLTESALGNDPTPGLVSRVAGDIGTGIKEAPSQVIRGIEKAANATSGAAFDAANWLNTNVLDMGKVTYDRKGSVNPMNWHFGYQKGIPSSNDLQIPDAAIPGPAESITGGLVEGVSQFAAGMVGAGKFLKVFNLGGTAAGLAGATTRTVEGAASMAVAFDPHEQRLSDLVQAYPALQNPVTEFLSLHPDDGPGMARVRSALEGLGMGAGTEGLLKGLGMLKAHFAGDSKAAIDLAHPPKIAPDQQTIAAEIYNPPGSSPTRPPSAEAQAAQKGAEGPSTGPAATPPGEAPKAPGEAPASPAGDAAPPAPDARPQKIITLTDDDLSRIQELKGNVEHGSTPDATGTFHPLSGIDTNLIEHDGDLGHVMDTLRVYYREAMDKATGGKPSVNGVAHPVQTFADVKKQAAEIADIVGDNAQLLLQRMATMHGNIGNMAAETRLFGDLLATVGDRLSTLARAVSDPREALPAGFANRAELILGFAKHYELMANVQAMYKGIQTGTARALNAFKIGSKINPDLIAGMANPDDLFHGGMKNMEALARQVYAAQGNLKGIAQATRPGFIKRFVGINNEYWVNSLLSGPITHSANIIGNSLSVAVLPAERMMAGAFRMGTQAGRQEFVEGGLHYVGMVQSIRDAIKMSAVALKMGDGLLDATHTQIGELGGHAITAANLGFRNETTTGRFINGLGTVIRIPSRLLTSEDEFFKQLVYRGSIRARAMREGFEQGMWNDKANPNAFGDHISKSLDNAVDGYRGADKQALEQARYATFQNNLEAATYSSGQTFGESFSSMTNNHPLLKVVLPFIRTPTNIMRFVWDRTPGLNLGRAQYANDLMGKNGSAAAASAGAKMATGGMLWASAITLALDGHVTGAGPSDKEASRALKATGWQPYAHRTQNEDGSFTYRAYNRMDPFASFYGLAADFAEVGAAHPERTNEDTAMALLTAVLKNVDNKTYISGLVSSLAALGDPEKRGKGFIQGAVGGYVPSFLKQTMLDDPLMREARTVVDALRARTPGFSAGLDPQRNVMGDAIAKSPTWGPEWASPVAQTQHPGGAQPTEANWRNTVQSKPEDEIARLIYNSGSPLTPPPKMHGQLDLTQVRSVVTGKTAYDRLQELTGTVLVEGKTLRETLTHMIKQPYYLNTFTDSDTLDKGSRIGAVRTWIGKYRGLAQIELGKEQPLLGQAFLEEKQRAGMNKYQH